MSLMAPIATITIAVWTSMMIFHAVHARVVDLSHTHGVNTYMSTPDMPKYTKQLLFDGDLAPGVYATWSKYSIAEHGGTHIDAPSHFVKGGYSLDQIPIENTIADGIMIDCSIEVARDPKYLLTLQKVLDWEENHGKIRPKAAVVLNFNWSHKFTNATEYLNPADPDDASTLYRFPSVSEEAINFLIDDRDVNILALDSMSPDLLNTLYPVHLKVLSKNKIIVENLKDPGLLPPKGFRFHASPVKFIGGTGVQTRVFAVIEEGCEYKGGAGAPACGYSDLVITIIWSLIVGFQSQQFTFW